MAPQPYVIITPNGSSQADEWARLGLASQQVPGKFPEAEQHYKSALRLDPRHAVATQNLAVGYATNGNMNEALITIERASLFDENNPIIHANMAFMNLDVDRIGAALEAAEAAVKVSRETGTEEDVHGFLSSRLALAMVSATAGMPEKSIPLYNEMLVKDPKHPIANPNVCFVQTLTNAAPADLLQQRAKWYANNRFTGVKHPHDNDRTPDRPLRVGYVGGDFKRHSAAMIFGHVILRHNKTRVQPYLYCTLPVDPTADVITKHFQDCGEWRDIANLTDEQAEALIRKDRIDILVDLAGHTNGGRLALFTRKPAPVQVTAWGFAHGTGVEEIDYFLADPIAVPVTEREHYAEKIADLPCIVSYLEPTEYGLKGSSTLPFYQNDFITFGSYGRYEKLSDECLATFAEILRRTPDSRLQFKDHAFRRPYSIRRIMAAMPDINPSRLLFSISTSHPEHMLAYHQADLMLDPFPHGGGVVSLEELYMGVPLVTLYGSQPSGRTAASALTCLGHTEWIAKTPAEYIDIAANLAQDVPALAKARKTLRSEFLASPVVAGYREAVEAKYKEMWQEWCARNAHN